MLVVLSGARVKGWKQNRPWEWVSIELTVGVRWPKISHQA